MPHCINAGRKSGLSQKPGTAKISGSSNSRRGYHLIIYDFRPINHPTKKQEQPIIRLAFPGGSNDDIATTICLKRCRRRYCQHVGT
jgi:hypothetical protein